MRVLITGATGLIGRSLANRLLEDAHEVTALTRDVARAERLLPARVRCELWQPGAELSPFALRGIDAIVHLAGEGIADGRWTAARKRAIRDSRIATTRAVVRAIAALPAAKKPAAFVSASALGIYGARGAEELTEQSAHGSGYLADVCQAWEREAFAAAHLGVRTAAVRIGIVLAEQGGALRKLLPPFRLGLGGRLGNGRQWMSWIHIADLVELFHDVLQNPRAEGPINAVAPAPVTNAAFAAELGRVLRRPAILPVPAPLLRIALGEMAAVLLASQKVRAEAASRMGFRYRFPTLQPALADLCSDFDEEIEREVWVARPPAEVFPFFADARNLERLTPDFLRFRVSGTSTPKMGEGTLIDYRLRLHGLPVRWQSRIERWEPGRRFVDRQTRGPYALWHHTHDFEPHAGGTLVRDRVRYRLPFGTLGELVAGKRVARDLDRIFDFRRERIREIFAETRVPSRAAGGEAR